MQSLVIFLLITMLASPSEAVQLTIGLIPEQNVFKQVKRYEPLGEYIGKKSGIGINFTILPRYGNIIERFAEKNLDGAFWGSFTGAMSIEKLGLEPIARPVNPDGTSSYCGYIFVHKKSGISTVAQMKNKAIVFVDKATTAGYVFPMAYFGQQGIENVTGYFREHYFAGSHDAAIYAVLSGDADVGCAKNTIYERLALEDGRLHENLRILAKSPQVPSNALGLRDDLDPEIRERIKQVLLDMHIDPEGRAVLKKFGVIRFVATTLQDYAPVFDLARQAGIDLRTYRYNND